MRSNEVNWGNMEEHTNLNIALVNRNCPVSRNKLTSDNSWWPNYRWEYPSEHDWNFSMHQFSFITISNRTIHLALLKISMKISLIPWPGHGDRHILSSASYFYHDQFTEIKKSPRIFDFKNFLKDIYRGKWWVELKQKHLTKRNRLLARL